MKFVDFQKTRRWCADFSQHPAEAVSDCEHGSPCGFVYEGNFYIEFQNGTWDTCIQGMPSDWHASLDAAEQQLWEFAKSEGWVARPVGEMRADQLEIGDRCKHGEMVGYEDEYRYFRDVNGRVTVVNIGNGAEMLTGVERPHTAAALRDALMQSGESTQYCVKWADGIKECSPFEAVDLLLELMGGSGVVMEGEVLNFTIKKL